jgi:hypothetical protein
MAISMYRISTPVFIRFLTSLSKILDKAAAHCPVHGVAPQTMLGMRLYPNMYSLTQQVEEAVRYATAAIAYTAALDEPVPTGGTDSFAAMRARIAAGVALLEGVPADMVDGREDMQVAIPFHGGERIFRAEDFVVDFCLPGFFFHLTTAYGILRHAGVEIGKADFRGEAG